MPLPRLYLDACMHHGIIPDLLNDGITVETAQAHGMAAASDAHQLAVAATHDFTLLSHNAVDYRREHALRLQAGRQHAGIICVPQNVRLPHDVGHRQLVGRVRMLVRWLASMPDYRNGFYRWGYLQFLLTQGHSSPGFTVEERHLALGRVS